MSISIKTLCLVVLLGALSVISISCQPLTNSDSTDTGISTGTEEDSENNDDDEDLDEDKDEPPIDTDYYCGDSEVQKWEDCDDGNREDSDGCSSTCHPEDGYICFKPEAFCVQLLVCGNERIEDAIGEICDDGNLFDNDGCSAECQIEEGWTCTSPGLNICYREDRCGDGILDSWECCEDGNRESGDGCSERCQIEFDDLPSTVMFQECTPIDCGNGILEPGEQCDDGINDGGYYECEPGCYFVHYCGNGIVEPEFEDCDDGNYDWGDGCGNHCRFFVDE